MHLALVPTLVQAEAVEIDPAAAVTFTMDPVTLVQFIIATIMPLVVGFFTYKTASAGVKAWGLAGSNLVISVLGEFVRVAGAGDVFDIGRALMLFVPAFVFSVGTYYGLLKPTGIAEKVQDTGVTKKAA